MASLARWSLGFAVMVAGIAAFLLGLYHVTKTGGCMSDATYASARPCPPGAGGWSGALLVGGLFGFLTGGAVFATRGRRAT
jgi:hypothetical protein